MNKIHIIGLTGGLASGKTTVSDLWQKLGVNVIDADVIASDVLKNTLVIKYLSDYFGDDILFDDGQINKAILREKSFAFPQNTKKLNSITHPLISESLRQEFAKPLNEKEIFPYRLAVIPLLFENQWEKYCTATITVDLAEDLQKQRALNRQKQTSTQINQIIYNQIGRFDRLNRANFVIDNSDGADLVGQINRIHNYLINLFALLND